MPEALPGSLRLPEERRGRRIVLYLRQERIDRRPRCAVLAGESRERSVVGVPHPSFHPTWVDRGIGSQLLRRAIDQLGPPIRLHTFQANARARRFYECAGFQPIAFGDGSDNEANTPDILYEWKPAP